MMMALLRKLLKASMRNFSVSVDIRRVETLLVKIWKAVMDRRNGGTKNE